MLICKLYMYMERESVIKVDIYLYIFRYLLTSKAHLIVLYMVWYILSSASHG